MNCKNCKSPNDSDSKFCKNCGASIELIDIPVVADANNLNSTQVPKSKKNIGVIVLLALVGASIVGTIFSQGQANSGSDLDSSVDQTTVEPTPTPVDWAPKGFTQYDDSLAFKYTTNAGAWPCEDCNFWKVTVVANVDCPGGVYAELNMMDSSDTVVDWTNDTVSYLAAGKKAILKFEHYPYDSSIKTGQLTKLSCQQF